MKRQRPHASIILVAPAMNSEFLQVLSALATPGLIFIAIVLAYFLASRWMRESRNFRLVESERMEVPLSDSAKKSLADIALDHSGYVVMRMPDADKPVFLEMLRGFEDYARIRGYRLSFAFDASMADRIAFRFSILEGGLLVGSKQVTDDLNEYIRRVQSGAGFDDLEAILKPDQHQGAITILKNRLAFLEASYPQMREIARLYHDVSNRLSQLQAPPSQQFFIQGGGTMAPTQYTAINSPQAAQGRDIKLIGNTATTDIKIGNTFAEQKEVIDRIDNVISLVARDKVTETDKDRAWQVYDLLKKVHGEIADEPKPDGTRIKRYLEKAADLFKSVAFAKEAVDAFHELVRTILS